MVFHRFFFNWSSASSKRLTAEPAGTEVNRERMSIKREWATCDANLDGEIRSSGWFYRELHIDPFAVSHFVGWPIVRPFTGNCETRYEIRDILIWFGMSDSTEVNFAISPQMTSFATGHCPTWKMTSHPDTWSQPYCVEALRSGTHLNANEWKKILHKNRHKTVHYPRNWPVHPDNNAMQIHGRRASRAFHDRTPNRCWQLWRRQ